jgi:hypothetical protein
VGPGKVRCKRAAAGSRIIGEGTATATAIASHANGRQYIGGGEGAVRGRWNGGEARRKCATIISWKKIDVRDVRAPLWPCCNQRIRRRNRSDLEQITSSEWRLVSFRFPQFLPLRVLHMLLSSCSFVYLLLSVGAVLVALCPLRAVAILVSRTIPVPVAKPAWAMAAAKQERKRRSTM